MRKTRNRPRIPTPVAGSFLNMAREYHLAATTLFGIRDQAQSPLYFLYTHAIELALKAYIRSRGAAGRSIHDLEALLQTSGKLGLDVSRDLRNVVGLLTSDNRHHGFRYFALVSTSRPDLAFLREVADAVMADVTVLVEATADDTDNRAAVVKLVFGKPEPK